MKSPLALIGFMGTFKSTAGKIAAQKLGAEFLDLDECIERLEGNSIAKIFDSFGEDYFRQKETAALKAAVKKNNVLISCGGGIVSRAENIEILNNSALSIWLFAEPEEIFKRISNSKNRPLFNAAPTIEGIKELYSKRESLYKKASAAFIDTTLLSPDEVANKIVEFAK